MALHRRSSKPTPEQAAAKSTWKFWLGFGVTLAFLILGVAIWQKDSWSASSQYDTGNSKIKRVPPSEVNRLKQEVFELNKKLDQQKTTIRIERLQRQIEIFQTILVSTNDQRDLEFAKIGFVNAYGGLVAMNEARNLQLPIVDDDQLEGLLKKFEEDENPKVRRAAYRLRFQRPMLELGIKPATPEFFEEMNRVIDAMAQKFLNDWEFIQEIAPICQFYKLKPDKAPDNAKILRKIVEAWRETTNTEIKTFVNSMQDEAALIESGFYKHFLLVPGQDEPAGEAIIDALPKYLSMNLGVTGIDRLLTTGEQFEMNQWLAGARTIFQKVLEHLAANSVPRSDELKTKAEYGLKRLALLGNVFRYEATDAKGVRHSTSDAIGRTTLIVFLESFEEINLLKPYRERLSTMEKFGFHCHVVILSQPLPHDMQNIKGGVPGISLFVDVDASSDFFKNCPITAAPYMLILDRQGRVVDLNVGVSRLMEVLERQVFGADQ